MKSVAAKAATSALRLASRLPADAAFFRAGALCRAAGDTNSAFVFLNRFLDIADAVDDAAEASFDSVSPSPRKSARASKSASKSLRALDNDDFGATDVPPPERLTLPSAHAVDEKSREEARDWVLTVSMDRAVTQQLPERACAEVRGVNLRRRFKVPQVRRRERAVRRHRVARAPGRARRRWRRPRSEKSGLGCLGERRGHGPLGPGGESRDQVARLTVVVSYGNNVLVVAILPSVVFIATVVYIGDEYYCTQSRSRRSRQHQLSLPSPPRPGGHVGDGG